MREIKFRAYFPGNNLIGNVTELEGSNDGYKFYRVLAECFEDGRQQFYSSSNFILLQFTGLLDSKGVEIYEGDILEENPGYYFEVIWDNVHAKFKLQWRIKAIQYPEWNRGVKMTIIGNIYQHPNLLES